jgi:hypothetical protein
MYPNLFRRSIATLIDVAAVVAFIAWIVRSPGFADLAWLRIALAVALAAGIPTSVSAFSDGGCRALHDLQAGTFVVNAWRVATATGRPWAYEMKIADPDGNTIWLGAEPKPQ